jgi:hypothetical protein
MMTTTAKMTRTSANTAQPTTMRLIFMGPSYRFK